MKKLLFAIAFVSVLPAVAMGQDVRVEGYYRDDGTYVEPHYRSEPDGNFDNNWSTKGNVNPHTGERGSRTRPSRDRSSRDYYDNSRNNYEQHRREMERRREREERRERTAEREGKESFNYGGHDRHGDYNSTPEKSIRTPAAAPKNSENDSAGRETHVGTGVAGRTSDSTDSNDLNDFLVTSLFVLLGAGGSLLSRNRLPLDAIVLGGFTGAFFSLGTTLLAFLAGTIGGAGISVIANHVIKTVNYHEEWGRAIGGMFGLAATVSLIAFVHWTSACLGRGGTPVLMWFNNHFLAPLLPLLFWGAALLVWKFVEIEPFEQETT